MDTDKFTVHLESRQRWPWEVRWNKGKVLCRTDSRKDAERIAFAMTRQRNLLALDEPLTEEESERIDQILGA